MPFSFKLNRLELRAVASNNDKRYLPISISVLGSNDGIDYTYIQQLTSVANTIQIYDEVIDTLGYTYTHYKIIGEVAQTTRKTFLMGDINIFGDIYA